MKWYLKLPPIYNFMVWFDMLQTVFNFMTHQELVCVYKWFPLCPLKFDVIS